MYTFYLQRQILHRYLIQPNRPIIIYSSLPFYLLISITKQLSFSIERFCISEHMRALSSFVFWLVSDSYSRPHISHHTRLTSLLALFWVLWWKAKPWKFPWLKGLRCNKDICLFRAELAYGANDTSYYQVHEQCLCLLRYVRFLCRYAYLYPPFCSLWLCTWTREHIQLILSEILLQFSMNGKERVFQATKIRTKIGDVDPGRTKKFQLATELIYCYTDCCDSFGDDDKYTLFDCAHSASEPSEPSKNHMIIIMQYLTKLLTLQLSKRN